MKLTITDPAAAEVGTPVVLIGRYDSPEGGARLLVRQNQVPHLIEISADHTDIADVEHDLVGEQELLEINKLLELTLLISEIDQHKTADS